MRDVLRIAFFSIQPMLSPFSNLLSLCPFSKQGIAHPFFCGLAFRFSFTVGRVSLHFSQAYPFLPIVFSSVRPRS